MKGLVDKLKQLCPCLPFPLFLPFSVLLVIGLQMSPSSKLGGKNSLCLTEPLATTLFLFLCTKLRMLCENSFFVHRGPSTLAATCLPWSTGFQKPKGVYPESSDISLQACHIHPITHHLVFLSYQPSVVGLEVSKLLQLLIYILLSSVKTPPQWQGLGQSGINFGSSAWLAALACAQVWGVNMCCPPSAPLPTPSITS